MDLPRPSTIESVGRHRLVGKWQGEASSVVFTTTIYHYWCGYVWVQFRRVVYRGTDGSLCWITQTYWALQSRSIHHSPARLSKRRRVEFDSREMKLRRRCHGVWLITARDVDWGKSDDGHAGKSGSPLRLRHHRSLLANFLSSFVAWSSSWHARNQNIHHSEADLSSPPYQIHACSRLFSFGICVCYSQNNVRGSIKSLFQHIDQII